MAKFAFHKIAAVAVLGAAAAWVLTGQFASVGSAAADTEKPAATEPAQGATKMLHTVGYVVVPPASHARAIRVSGQTDADKRATLATRAAGVITALPVKEGDRVKKGDLILKLDPEGREAAVANAQQLLAQREAEAAAAEQLAKRGNMAKLQLDGARSALKAAEAQLQAALADMQRTTVVAPFDGVIDKLPVEDGSSVSQGGAVATLIALDPLRAVGAVSERDIGSIHVGSQADVHLVNGKTVTGSVSYISRDANAQTRTYRVEVSLPNRDLAIPAGMTAEITFWSEPVSVVRLPRSVVTLNGEGELGIRVVGDGDIVKFYPIDIVDDTPGGLYLAGIPTRARIIVAGQDFVNDGDKVKAVEADPETLAKLVSEAGAGE